MDETMLLGPPLDDAVPCVPWFISDMTKLPRKMIDGRHQLLMNFYILLGGSSPKIMTWIL